MNKQQLASKIWESANKMRSKIEANEYKDYILGFVFYKFLSDNEIKWLKGQYYEDKDIEKIKESDKDVLKQCQDGIGYFIAYKDLFSTWLKNKNDFNVSDVRDALSAFNRNIDSNHKKLFNKIFDTLQIGLSKLGENAAQQTRAIKDLLTLIKDIPTNDSRQDYDVLGFVYEYLISNFAANAGKKAGEFYTPHEVSYLMSEIVSYHLRNKKEISIYDPTSGSGSLLINIGKSVQKYIGNSNNIKYYAQELKENTYNLTRMNLVMRGILPSNIECRCGDTLEDDWPLFDENDPVGTYKYISVDAVVSNPPYSQNWNQKQMGTDVRFNDYGIAPKKKADYAFLLHDLYHINSKGIVTIVLPHGVLFRGGDEKEIRKNLIENEKIDAIIGLPSNIFFGTGIPTIIMVLKQKRDDSDILIIDASKGFEKVGKNNVLRACDIKKIVDTIKERKNIDKYSKVVSKKEIRENDYNLNISRYVDSNDEIETYDIYSEMFGGVPDSETKKYDNVWKELSTLKEDLFEKINDDYLKCKTNDINETIKNNKSMQKFVKKYDESFIDYHDYLYTELIKKLDKINIQKEEEILSNDLFSRLKDFNIINNYSAYQVLYDNYKNISQDIEIIQTESFDATRKIDPNMVIKKVNGKDEEVQDGFIGHILPFELVQKVKLKDLLLNIENLKNRKNEIEGLLSEFIENLSEDDKQNLLNDDNTKFQKKELNNAINAILDDIDTEETKVLNDYLNISKKNDKLEFVKQNKNIKWNEMTKNKDGIYTTSEVKKYITDLKKQTNFEEGSFEYIVFTALKLIDELKDVNSNIDKAEIEIIYKTIDTIKNLTDKEVKELLDKKWIEPIVESIKKLPDNFITEFSSDIEKLSKKYDITYENINNDIDNIKKELVDELSELTGSEYDMKGIKELRKILT